MDELSNSLKNNLYRLGADIVGFGNLNELPTNVREGLPTGICIAIAYPKDVIKGITDLPTLAYCEWYDRINEKLDMIVTSGAEFLRENGYNAVAQTRERVGNGEHNDTTILPHKTIATRAGVGWIGKSALLVTPKYGSAIRISSILTDAPLETGFPINQSDCGDCLICANACPAGAVSGILWNVGLYRDAFFDAVKCRKTARERAKQGFGGDMTICGKCIEVCPHTQRYLYNTGEHK